GHRNYHPLVAARFEVRAGGYAQCLVVTKPRQQPLEIVEWKLHVAVQFDDEIERRLLDQLVSCSERLNLGNSKLPVAGAFDPGYPDPIILFCIPLQDLRCLVARPVIDNYPPHWPDGLAKDCVDRPFQIDLLVLYGRNDYVVVG